MANMDLYEKIRRVPQEAQKTINAGRLKGMTDINPMWRIKVLTEQFGVCGIGWYYECTRQWIEEVGDERVACVNINLYVKVDGEWSKPIFGTGGSKLSTNERSGIYVSDECYKMATTDAISVACKSLGMGADVYWSGDRTKYSSNSPDKKEEEVFNKQCEEIGKQKIPKAKVNIIKDKCVEYGLAEKTVLSKYRLNAIEDMTEKQFVDALATFERTPKNNGKQG